MKKLIFALVTLSLCITLQAARNGSGVYTLPAGNPVTSGSVISSTWANNTFADVAAALSQSLSKDGQTQMTSNLNMGGNQVTNASKFCNTTTCGASEMLGINGQTVRIGVGSNYNGIQFMQSVTGTYGLFGAGSTDLPSLSLTRTTVDLSTPGLSITDSAGGISFSSFMAFSNGTDADLFFYISQVGSSHKFARISPSFSVPLQLGNQNSPVQSYGPIASAWVDATPDKGTFTITYGGFVSNPTCTATWNRMGNVVVLNLCGVTSTSNSVTMTGFSLPAAITPGGAAPANQFAPCTNTQDGGTVNGFGGVTMQAGNSTITFSKGPGQGISFTATGTKGISSSGCVITYLLGN